ncbi:glucosyltransferase domain-containing protein [Ochrobactrum sp. S1502_03]|uniref:glucosyltransferase domain-containing protein n=1 Tax=Ochrobactrum sp. S1502_03 TaxID=3108451 RepID=UPI0037CB4404
MKLNLINNRYYIVSCLAALLLPLLYLDFLGHDNTATLYADMVGSPWHWIGQLSNYRYLNAALAWILFQNSINYYSLIYIWSVLFSISIVWACVEFCRFSDFDDKYIPIFTLLVITNGYFSDLYIFSMVFSAYAIAFASVAIALYSARKHEPIVGIIVSTLALTFCLMSYQVEALIALFAASSAAITASFAGKDTLPWKRILIIVPSFFLSIILFLIVKHFIGPTDGRGVNFSNVSGNLIDYLNKIPEILTSGIEYYTSANEILFYLIILSSSALLLIYKACTSPSYVSIVSFVSYVLAVLIIACPLSLMGDTVWIGARMMTASVFFFASLPLIFQKILGGKYSEAYLFIIIGFIAISIFNQVQFHTFMRGQDERDKLAVEMISRDIAKVVEVGRDTKLSVVQINFPNRMMSDWRLSAFGAEWSRSKIFHVLTGRFIEVSRPDGSCNNVDPQNDWAIELHDDVVVVCLQ